MIHFIKDNRFVTFLDRLVYISKYEKSNSYIDMSPQNLFDAPNGTVLVKVGTDIMYKSPGDESFTNLSNMFPYLIAPRRVLLEQGINKNVTWIKNSATSLKTWKFIGYITPYGSDCLACPLVYYST